MENLTIKDEYFFKLMLETNVDPLTQMHASWLSHLPHGGLCLKLAANPEARGKLQEYLQNHYAWIGKHEFEAIHWPGQLAILPAKQLQRALLYLGIWYCSQEIRHLINARDVAKMRSALGEDGYHFAIKQAPFISGIRRANEISSQSGARQGGASSAKSDNQAKNLVSDLLKEKKLPPLRHSSAKKNDNSQQSDSATGAETGPEKGPEKGIVETFSRIGLKLMFKELTLLAEPLRMRLFSKLPYSWYLERQQLQSDPLMAIDEDADALLIKRIIVECLPQCSNMLQ